MKLHSNLRKKILLLLVFFVQKHVRVNNKNIKRQIKKYCFYILFFLNIILKYNCLTRLFQGWIEKRGHWGKMGWIFFFSKISLVWKFHGMLFNFRGIIKIVKCAFKKREQCIFYLFFHIFSFVNWNYSFNFNMQVNAIFFIAPPGIRWHTENGFSGCTHKKIGFHFL